MKYTDAFIGYSIIPHNDNPQLEENGKYSAGFYFSGT